MSDSDDPKGKGKTSDPDDLARRFLSLWQAQVAATADGSDAADAIGRLYAGLGADTSRLGEGFEAWGRLIGDLAAGGKSGMTAFSGLAGMAGMANPFGAAKDTSTGTQGRGGQDHGAAQGRDGHADNDRSQDRQGTVKKDARATGGKDSFQGSEAQVDSRKTDSGQENVGQKHDASSGQGATDAKSKDDRSKDRGERTGKEAAAPRGAKAAGDASGRRDDEVAELSRRIAAIQKTIAALEAGTSDRGDGTSDGDGKP